MASGTSSSAPEPVGIATIGRGLALDVGLPLAAYYALHMVGASDWVALLAGMAVAGVRIAVVALRTRTPNPFAMVLLVSFGMGLTLALFTGDIRFLLLKDSMTTAVVGLMFLGLAAVGQPLTLAAAKTWEPARAEVLSEQFRTSSAVRHWHLTASVVWGVGLLVEAAVRVPLVYLLPVAVMVAVSAGLMITSYAALVGWTGWYLRRARARGASRAHAAVRRRHEPLSRPGRAEEQPSPGSRAPASRGLQWPQPGRRSVDDAPRASGVHRRAKRRS